MPSCIAMAPLVKGDAALLGARVTLLHVCDLTSSNGFELYVRAPQEIAQERWSIARCKINSFLESEFPLASCPRVLHCGNAAEQIVAAAIGFDLIIMPTHAGRFRRMLLGSTTAKVLNNVHCPVLSAEHIQVVASRPLGYRQWVCALAFNADSARVLNLANHAAAEVGAKLLLVHVVESNSGKVNCAAEWAATQRSKLFVDRSKRHFSTWLGKHRRTCSSLAGL
ncbi:MAG: universal stress protein [Acidobacteriaceae bacterium]|nr:universal stress protein [Acidobacteriaceae bacterium]